MDADSKCMEQDPSTQLRTGDSEQDADFDSKVSSPSIVDSPPFSKLSITEGKNGTAHLKNGLGASSEPYHDAEPVKKLRCLCRFKMIYVICVVVVAVWGLLSLPIIFYHLPEHKESPTTNGECSASFPYPTAGGVCRAELEGILLSMECDSGGTPLVLRDEESTARQLTAGFSFLNPSPECEEEVVPFLCLFLFGLCDSSGVSLQPTSGQCEHLRDGVCSTEWSTALSIGVDLPDCNSFPAEQASCPDQSGSGSGVNSTAPQNNTRTPTLLPCRDDFYREEGSDSCVPSCATWHEYSQIEVIFIDVVIILSTVIGFIAGLAVVVFSIIRFERMFSFPSIFIVCLTTDLIVFEFLIMVSYFDRPSLYCVSPKLEDSFFEVTSYCVITGMVFLYILLQLAIWWIFHTTAIFWQILFPLHARSYQTSRKLKIIYIVCIIVGILIPLVPIIASMADFADRVKTSPLLQQRGVTFWSGGLGYGVTRFPPILCTATNSAIVYYGVVLPINIIMIVGISELIIILWKIHKQFGLLKEKTSKFPIKIGTPERKILLALCYYVLIAVFAVTSFTLATRNSGSFSTLLMDYFACERGGHDAEMPCDRNTFRQLSYPEVTALAFVVLNLFPAVNLVYALNVKELREKCKMCRKVKRGSTMIRDTSIKI